MKWYDRLIDIFLDVGLMFIGSGLLWASIKLTFPNFNFNFFQSLWFIITFKFLVIYTKLLIVKDH